MRGLESQLTTNIIFHSAAEMFIPYAGDKKMHRIASELRAEVPEKDRADITLCEIGFYFCKYTFIAGLPTAMSYLAYATFLH